MLHVFRLTTHACMSSHVHEFGFKHIRYKYPNMKATLNSSGHFEIYIRTRFLRHSNTYTGLQSNVMPFNNKTLFCKRLAEISTEYTSI